MLKGLTKCHRWRFRRPAGELFIPTVSAFKVWREVEVEYLIFIDAGYNSVFPTVVHVELSFLKGLQLSLTLSM